MFKGCTDILVGDTVTESLFSTRGSGQSEAKFPSVQLSS